MGRPSKLNAERQAKIVQALRAGNYFDTACGFAGIDKSTAYRWLERGEQAKSGIYYDFRDAVQKASADAEVTSVAIISKAAPDTWQAAAWWLERRFPSKWGRRVNELHGKDGAPLLDAELLLKMLRDGD